MKVLFSPPPYKANPYVEMLVQALQQEHVDFHFYIPGRFQWRSYDVFHVNWPETLLNGKHWRRYPLFILIFLQLLWQKLRGARVVHTVHNLLPHSDYHSPLPLCIKEAFLRWSDAYVFLTGSALQEAYRQRPALRKKACFVVPHPSYVSAYQKALPAEEARQALDLDLSAETKVILYFGTLRPYKGIDNLIQAFKGVENSHLIIAGQAYDAQIGAEFRRLTADNTAITLHDRYIDESDVHLYFSACDLVVLPYNKVFSSGAAILALSFGRPVLLAHHVSLQSLQTDNGPDWIRFFEAPLSADVLTAAVDWSGNTSRHGLPPAANYSPQHAASAFMKIYQSHC